MKLSASRAQAFFDRAELFSRRKKIRVLATLAQFGVRIRHRWSEPENSSGVRCADSKNPKLLLRGWIAPGRAWWEKFSLRTQSRFAARAGGWKLLPMGKLGRSNWSR